jgi:hypothetical protein
MLVLKTIAKVRRLHLSDSVPIKAICQDVGLSRNVLRKILRSGVTEFHYKRAQQPRRALGAWQGEL